MVFIKGKVRYLSNFVIVVHDLQLFAFEMYYLTFIFVFGIFQNIFLNPSIPSIKLKYLS